MAAPSINQDSVKLFMSDVKQRYQERGKLLSAIKTRDIVGEKAQFPVVGSLDSKERVLGQLLPMSDIVRAPVEITVKNYISDVVFSDVFAKEGINYDEVTELSGAVMRAIERRYDQVVIDALAATASSKSVAKNVSGANANLTVAAVQAAALALGRDGVPDDKRFLMVHESGVHALLADPKATSADYMNVKALMAGDINTFYGFKILKIGDRTVGGVTAGLPKATNDRTGFAFHYDSIAVARKINIEPVIDWSAERASYLVYAKLAIGAKEIDPLGIVKVVTLES